MNKKENAKVKELREQGKDVWSISRLNSFHNCKYGYYESYVNEEKTPEERRGKPNIYSFAGSELHDILEDIHNNKATEKDLIKTYDDILIKSKALGITFPNELIENSWKKDLSHFVNSFKKLDYDMVTEKQFIFEVVEDIWIQGFIDAMYRDENGDITILDWKTSSKFSGDKRTEAGRQLLLYKLAVESEFNKGKEIKKIAWYMMKYVYVRYNGRKKMCSRRQWVKECKDNILKALKLNGGEDFINEMLLEKAIQDNNIKELPEEVQKKFAFEDCIWYYDITPKLIEECKEYIKNTVDLIKNETEWKPVEINKSTEFFCNTLCNHRDTCKYLLAYKEGDTSLGNQIDTNLMNLFN